MYATKGLMQLSKKGTHCTQFEELQGAYLYERKLVLRLTDGQSEYWAAAPISVIHQRLQAGLVMEYSYDVHFGSLPASITKNAREIRIVPVKPTTRPPEFHPREKSELPVAIFADGRSCWLGFATGGTNSEVYSVGYPIKCTNDLWVYPLCLAMPITLAFDLVTSPIQGAIAKERHDAPWPF
jgi:hypothetical protein